MIWKQSWMQAAKIAKIGMEMVWFQIDFGVGALKSMLYLYSKQQDFMKIQFYYRILLDSLPVNEWNPAELFLPVLDKTSRFG